MANTGQKPYLAFCFYRLNEGWTSHCLNFNDVVIKKNLNFIYCWHCRSVLKQNIHCIKQHVGNLMKLQWQYLSFLDYIKAVSQPYCISVLDESEVEFSPFILHLLHIFLQCVFFTGQCTNLFQSIAKVNMNYISFCSALVQMYSTINIKSRYVFF